MYPAVLLMYLISASVILLASLALIVQVPLPYNKTGRANILYSFILVFQRDFYGLNTLFKITVIFKSYLICYHFPILLDKIHLIIFVYCNWVVTRWQWLFYMYTKYEIGYY